MPPGARGELARRAAESSDGGDVEGAVGLRFPRDVYDQGESEVRWWIWCASEGQLTKKPAEVDQICRKNTMVINLLVA